MNTMPAEYRTDIARLAEDMAKRDVEAAKRDKDNLRWVFGLFIAGVAIIIGAVGFLIP